MLRRLLLISIALFPFPLFATEVTVGWISRQPEIPYVWGSTNPAVEGWPAVGTEVTWRAHVRSWYTTPKTVEYVWRVNGAEVVRGNVTLDANGYTTVDLQRPWSFARQELSFAIDTGRTLAEESEKNNELAVFTDALAVGFWVEQSFYDHFRLNQQKLGIGSTSFEDWAQRTIAYWNDMAALAVYPETPNGVLDRVRLQKIVIVPDDALPLNGLPDGWTPGANGGSHPDKDDQTVDLMWGFRKDTLVSYQKLTTADPTNLFYVGYAILHELGHARYLVDLYAWDVLHRGSEYAVNITEGGLPIVGRYVPSTPFRTPEQGIMNSHYTFIDRYSAIVLNFIAGHRAVMGNYNEPRNFASFLNDLPAQNRLTIRDHQGNPIPDADVWFYYSVANGANWYATNYDDTPDLKLRTDANGQVLVGRSPFAADGKVVHTYGMTNGVAIVRVAKPGSVAYGFLESRLFNHAYWRGETDFADHTLYVGLTCNAVGPQITAPAWDAVTGEQATLQWNALPNATTYRVYASSGLRRPRLLATTTGTSVEVTVRGRTHWWVEADLGLCGTRRSGTGLLNAPGTAPFPRRRAVRH